MLSDDLTVRPVFDLSLKKSENMYAISSKLKQSTKDSGIVIDNFTGSPFITVDQWILEIPFGVNIEGKRAKATFYCSYFYFIENNNLEIHNHDLYEQILSYKITNHMLFSFQYSYNFYSKLKEGKFGALKQKHN